MDRLNQKRRLPLGISDYRTIVDNHYLYVDKTEYIEKLENVSRYAFLLRPRRFGKTLFTSTLEYYYGINYKDDFERLFGNTYIGQNPTEDRNSYYVLQFSFTGLKTDTEKELVESFRNSTLESYEKFCEKYNLKLDYKKEGEPADILANFVTKFIGAVTDGELFVIIDEYDHFANELLSFQTQLFSKLVAKTGFVRKWYEKIKDGTAEGVIQRFFATGVSPITLDSLTSGFNIAEDYTRDIWFNEIMGFTEKEVRYLIDETLPNMSQTEKDSIYGEMKKYYNGYLFCEDTDVRVFNSNMSLSYLAAYARNNKPPRTLLNTSIASDYSKLRKLFALKDRSSNYEVVQEILEGQPQHAVITSQFSLEKRFDKDDFRSLLFYLGYLTIGSFDGMRLDLVIPNYVVKELYFSYFEEMLREEYKYHLETTDYRDALWLVAKDGDNSGLVACLETILGAMSNRDAIGMDEKRLQAICFAICMPAGYYVVESENEANKGYIDLQLMKQSGVNVNYYAIIEFKYLSKADGTEANINKQLADAKGQLAKYSAAPKFKEMNNLKKWAVVFVGDKCVRNVEV